MAKPTNQKQKRPVAIKAQGTVNAVRLETLLDKLVAVQLDLEPACKVPGVSPAIVEACEILHSAIADLRNIIGQVHGMKEPPRASRAI